MATARDNVRQDESEVRGRGENDEGAHKGIEGRSAADIYAAQQRVNDTAGQRRVERVLEAAVDVRDPARERRCVVAAERPQHAPGCDVASGA